MRRLTVLVLALVFLAAAPTAAWASGLPGVLTQLKPAFQVRPAVISYTGDGTGLVGGFDGSDVRHPGHLRWTTYDAHEGIARGLLWLDDCMPDCARGTFTAVPVNVHVFAPKDGRFRRLTLTYIYGRKTISDRRGIRHYPGVDGAPGYWQYYIISG